jgi:hypothetical protein
MKYYLVKSIKYNTVLKRNMHRVSNVANAAMHHIPSPNQTGRVLLSRSVSYFVDNTDAFKSTHELAQENPLLKKNWSNSPINNSFQHPTYGRVVCDLPNCSDRLCDSDKPCGNPVEYSYVGHATHSNYPGSVYLSDTDLNKQSRKQFGIFYKRPIRSYSGEQYRNHEKTEELNHNKDVQALIHIYSSRNPLDDAI